MKIAIKTEESPIGNYMLVTDELLVRCQVGGYFKIQKGHIISVLENDPSHGNILVSYGQDRMGWKHISVLKDFKRVK